MYRVLIPSVWGYPGTYHGLVALSQRLDAAPKGHLGNIAGGQGSTGPVGLAWRYRWIPSVSGIRQSDRVPGYHGYLVELTAETGFELSSLCPNDSCYVPNQN
jgi:hypothetical protein